jgi:heme-degrading monooxygenase HmoA
MAVVVVAEMEGGNQDFYERVSGRSMPDGELPEGAKVHIAGPTESGWRVITVWDSEEQFAAFRNDRLIPALQAEGGEDRVAPAITANPVHRLITA